MLYLTLEGTLSENVKAVRVKDSEDEPAEYAFTLVCTDCRETHDSAVTINCYEKHEMPGSKGEASFIVKCKFCAKDCSVNMNKFEDALYNVENDSNEEAITAIKLRRKKNSLKSIKGSEAALLEFDCRGCELTEFKASSVTFLVELNSGATLECQFEDGEDEWYDYDDTEGQEVSITDLKVEIIKNK